MASFSLFWLPFSWQILDNICWGKSVSLSVVYLLEMRSLELRMSCWCRVLLVVLPQISFATWTKWWAHLSSIPAAWLSWCAILAKVSTGCDWTPSPFHNTSDGGGRQTCLHTASTHRDADAHMQIHIHILFSQLCWPTRCSVRQTVTYAPKHLGLHLLDALLGQVLLQHCAHF